jgi:hypothetical protein
VNNLSRFGAKQFTKFHQKQTHTPERISTRSWSESQTDGPANPVFEPSLVIPFCLNGFRIST